MTTKKTIPLLALLSAFPPLSTDMYLPALPMLRQLWQVPLVVVNMTLVAFFIAYCLFLLVYGPVSDRFGRRRPLLAGIGLYILASVLCAFSPGVTAMIVFRGLQAAGAASASALSMAICKDLFEARLRERIIAYIAVIMAFAPMLAPIVGGWIMTFLSWPWVFVVQAMLGAVALVGVYRMPGSLKTRSSASAREILGGYLRLMRNRRFLAVSVLALPFFAFIAGSSSIYISRFGLSERAFGYFFAFNAIALMAGATAFSRLTSRFASAKLMTAGFAGIVCAGFFLATLRHTSPWHLAVPVWFMSFFFGLSRPPSNNLILEQVDRDAGSASSMIVFSYMMFGAGAMWTISLGWSDPITIIGVLALASAGLTLSFWLLFRLRFSAVR